MQFFTPHRFSALAAQGCKIKLPFGQRFSVSRLLPGKPKRAQFLLAKHHYSPGFNRARRLQLTPNPTRRRY